MAHFEKDDEALSAARSTSRTYIFRSAQCGKVDWGLVEGNFDQCAFTKALQRSCVIFGSAQHPIARRSPALQPLRIMRFGRVEPLFRQHGVGQPPAGLEKLRVLPSRIEKAPRGMRHATPGYATLGREAKMDLPTYR